LLTYQRALDIRFTPGKDTLDSRLHTPPHVRGEDSVTVVDVSWLLLLLLFFFGLLIECCS
jgi:hypothetical protein